MKFYKFKLTSSCTASGILYRRSRMETWSQHEGHVQVASETAARLGRPRGGGCGQSRLVASSTGPGHRPRLNRPRYVTPSRCESESVWLGIRQLARGRTPLRTPPRSAGPMQSRPAASSPASRVLRSGCWMPGRGGPAVPQWPRPGVTLQV